MYERPGEEELEQLVRRFTPELWPVACAFTTSIEDAEDPLQDVWMIAAARMHERAEAAPLGAWLYSVALNRGRAHRRRKRRRFWLRRLWAADLPASIDETVSPRIEPALRSHALWRAVSALPSLQRDVLLLRIVDGYSTRESAQLLDRAEGTVKASLHRALVALRRHLSDNEPEALL